MYFTLSEGVRIDALHVQLQRLTRDWSRDENALLLGFPCHYALAAIG